VSADASGTPHTHTFPEVQAGQPASDNHLTLSDLLAVRMDVTAELGSTTMLVRDVLALKVGSILPLDKNAGEMTDIYLNDLPIARGEVVVIGDNLSVRLSEVGGVTDRVDLAEGDEAAHA
jgi:flagellar motor switch protein FliN